MMKTMTHKETYTEWWIKYPWHASNKPYPIDKDGNCTCECEYCLKDGVHAHKVKRQTNES